MPQEEIFDKKEDADEGAVKEEVFEEAQVTDTKTDSNTLFTSFFLDTGSMSGILGKDEKKKKKTGKKMPTLFSI